MDCDQATVGTPVCSVECVSLPPCMVGAPCVCMGRAVHAVWCLSRTCVCGRMSCVAVCDRIVAWSRMRASLLATDVCRLGGPVPPDYSAHGIVKV